MASQIDSPQGGGRDLAIGVAGNIEARTMRQFISSGSSFENDIGYSRAVVDCEWVFVSGTTGFDYATMTIADAGGAVP